MAPFALSSLSPFLSLGQSEFSPFHKQQKDCLRRPSVTIGHSFTLKGNPGTEYAAVPVSSFFPSCWTVTALEQSVFLFTLNKHPRRPSRSSNPLSCRLRGGGRDPLDTCNGLRNLDRGLGKGGVSGTRSGPDLREPGRRRPEAEGKQEGGQGGGRREPRRESG